jgi:hypothetical protein
MDLPSTMHVKTWSIRIADERGLGGMAGAMAIRSLQWWPMYQGIGQENTHRYNVTVNQPCNLALQFVATGYLFK